MRAIHISPSNHEGRVLDPYREKATSYLVEECIWGILFENFPPRRHNTPNYKYDSCLSNSVFWPWEFYSQLGDWIISIRL